eukprot:GFKZ01005267.1.p2 GENE.GFKZ01005267.1~~GFKZ01005267.1.p2  ORF type:complete len:196 (-),score=14.60 GFKZ01005267.1:994-1581(-)
MPPIDAFVPSSLPTAFPLPNSACRPQLTPCFRKPITSPRLAKRRLRPFAQTPTPENPQPETPDPNPEPATSTDVPRNLDPDRDASDLVLPNLKELFAGAGHPDCPQCDGDGVITCPVCDGKGYIAMTMMDTTSSTQCRMCRGSRVIPCPSCRDIVYKSVVWWDQIPSEEEDPDENWRTGPDGEPRIPWTPPPVGP